MNTKKTLKIKLMITFRGFGLVPLEIFLLNFTPLQ